MAVKEKQIKDPEKEQDAMLKVLKVLSAIGTAVDTHKNVLFAGEKGREKYKATDFKNADSIFENAVEGTDVAENFGMKPGGVPAYSAGLLYDILNPVGIAASGAAKVSRLAKLLTPLESASEWVGKKVVKNQLPKYIEKNVRNLKDIPLSKRIAEEAIETGASKQLSNPKKGLKILKGEKKLVRAGGTKELPINKVTKSDGSMDKVGKKLEETVQIESSDGRKVNKGDIYRKEMDKLKSKNIEGIDYKKSEEAKSKVLEEALSPFERKTKTVIEPPPVPQRPASLDLPSMTGDMEKIVNKRRGESLETLFDDNVVQLPPPVPGRGNGRSLEDAIAGLEDARSTDKLKEVMEKDWEGKLVKGKPVSKEIPEVLDVESSLEDLWKKKIALRKEFKDSTFGKPMHEWSDKDRTLEAVIDEIDEQLVKKMSPMGQDSYKGLNQKYQAQAKLSDIFEDQLQNETRGGGQILRTGVEAGTGGAMNPAARGRMAKGAWDALTGPKMKVKFGNTLQNRSVTTPGYEFLTEAAEIPYDQPYLEDKTERTEDVEIDMDSIPEEPVSSDASIPDESRSPSSVVEIPEAEGVDEILGPDIDMDSVPEEPQDPIHTKMDEVLQPQKQVWDPYVNEEVLNTYLPRDSKRILANPAALMAKVQQVAPNQVPMIQELLDNDKEGMAEAGPKIAMMFPTIFEKDKYDMFDGKILDPMMQQKFLKDLSDDEGMDSIEKANMSMKIQRGESIHS